MKTTIYKNNTYGYLSYRIPCLAVSNKGTLLAFCEARRTCDDYAVMDIILRRKEAGAKSFSNIIIVTPKNNPSDTYNNPCVYILGNEIHLIYCKNYLEIYHVVSVDDGLTFSSPEQITYAVKNNKNLLPYSAVATGPDGAIVTNDGKIIIASWIATGNENTGSKHDNSSFFLLYSLDMGKTWQTTNKIIPIKYNASETVAVELDDGTILFNVRSINEKHRRMIIKCDKNFNFSNYYFDNALIEQVCMASLTKTEYKGNTLYLFTNPNYSKDYTIWVNRKELTLKISNDNFNTWNYSKIIKKGTSGYSSVKSYNGKIYVLYESYKPDKPMNLVLYEVKIDSVIKNQA